MKIIELQSDYDKFLSENYMYDWLLVPTYSNGSYPVHIDTLSVLYVYVFLKDEEYMIAFNHTEASNIPQENVDRLPKTNRLYVHNKTRFLSVNQNDNLIDIDLAKYFETNSAFEDDYDTPAHNWFTQNFRYYKNLNTIIPILKHYERGTNIRNSFLEYYTHDVKEHDAFIRYNDYFTRNFHAIAKNGLHVNPEVFRKYFLDTSCYNGYTYSEYNIYTSTGRPSNRFNGINFAALNKDNGCRASFTSRFGEGGFLINFDFDGYHIRLLSQLVNYDFPIDESVHHHLGQYYFNKQQLSDSEYEESKKISFRLLYGGITKEYLHIDFYKRIYDLTQLLWKSYNEMSYIETPLFNRKLYKNFFKDMNASKLLNYLLQSFETERNCLVLDKLNKKQMKSKIILYTYDSFLIDFNKEDGAEIITYIKEEMESGKFPVKIEIGYDYQNMIPTKIG